MFSERHVKLGSWQQVEIDTILFWVFHAHIVCNVLTASDKKVLMAFYGTMTQQDMELPKARWDKLRLHKEREAVLALMSYANGKIGTRTGIKGQRGYFLVKDLEPWRSPGGGIG